MKAPIHSVKHYVQNSLATVMGGAVVNLTLIAAQERDTIALPQDVVEGAIIKACFIEQWIRAGSLTGASGQWIIWKRSGDMSDPTAADMAALGAWDNKKNILATGMGLFNDQDADAIPVVRGWYKIPKGKQRFGLKDVLKFSIFTPTIDLHICGFTTYKEYT